MNKKFIKRGDKVTYKGQDYYYVGDDSFKPKIRVEDSPHTNTLITHTEEDICKVLSEQTRHKWEFVEMEDAIGFVVFKHENGHKRHEYEIGWICWYKSHNYMLVNYNSFIEIETMKKIASYFNSMKA